ncbi:MAG: arsenic resistance N-acetyltransferase ArsN2 [Spirosomataceae bacterium]
MAIAIALAVPTDQDAITQVLTKAQLPTQDLPKGTPHFLVAKDKDTVVGTAGVEIHGFYALLRSVAVEEAFQNQGIAKQLTKAAIKEAIKQDVCEIYLITTSAEQYFKKQGFEQVERSDVPPEIAQTSQFSDVCPSSAVVMRKLL